VTDKNGFFDLSKTALSRRTALKGLAAGAGLAVAPGFIRYSQAQSSAPIKIGFQSHRTGIGAAYGRWYEKTTAAAIKAIFGWSDIGSSSPSRGISASSSSMTRTRRST